MSQPRSRGRNVLGVLAVLCGKGFGTSDEEPAVRARRAWKPEAWGLLVLPWAWAAGRSCSSFHFTALERE